MIPHEKIGMAIVKSPDKWQYSIISLPTEDFPFKFRPFAECCDNKGNYRGVCLGSFKNKSSALASINAHIRNEK